MRNISDSLIKKFKQQDYCPHKIKLVSFDKMGREEPGPAMVNGSYFESLCLGLPDVPEPPRLKNGNKSVDVQRIETQAVKFFGLLHEYKMEIQETQIEIIQPYNEKYQLKGILDFTSPFIDNELGFQPIAIFDLKLTKSIYAELNYDNASAPWSWAFPFNKDHTQAYMYNYLFELQFGANLPFYYFVFDYKPEPEFKIIRKKIGQLERAELIESIEKTIDAIEMNEQLDWPKVASYKNCKTCPIKNVCDDSITRQPVSTV